ncbi:Rieske (2Fe-2S) protein [Cupriavidus sp. 2KB_3]|uniref:Rieske (2Fe-2S) protein n=1 Tax=Cupriavidus sp. 2KB_3 TaxID=3232980 RepID=UPI003F908DDB
MDTTMLCHLDAVPDGGARVINRDPGVIVVRRGQQVWAYINRCPHFSIPLDFEPGTICTYEAEVLMCAHHSALFRFADGVCIDGPCRDATLSSLAVQVIDGRVCLC